MTVDPRELEAKAKAAEKAANWHAAIDAWNALLEFEPRWEFGYPRYFLAACYFALGDLDKSEEAIERQSQLIRRR